MHDIFEFSTYNIHELISKNLIALVKIMYFLRMVTSCVLITFNVGIQLISYVTFLIIYILFTLIVNFTFIKYVSIKKLIVIIHQCSLLK